MRKSCRIEINISVFSISRFFNSCQIEWFDFFFSLQSTQIGTTVFKDLSAKDIDAGVNGLVEYFIIEGTNNYTSDVTLTANDGYGIFSIPFPHQGQITLMKSLDYERTQKYYLTVIASVRLCDNFFLLKFHPLTYINYNQRQLFDKKCVFLFHRIELEMCRNELPQQQQLL